MSEQIPGHVLNAWLERQASYPSRFSILSNVCASACRMRQLAEGQHIGILMVCKRRADAVEIQALVWTWCGRHTPRAAAFQSAHKWHSQRFRDKAHKGIFIDLEMESALT